MQRIVYGHFADPDSTRDITGVTPDEFEVIITALQQYHKGIEAIVKATPEQRKILCNTVADANGEASFESGFDDEQTWVDNLAQPYNLTYKILTDINQPYPGAEYNPPD